MHVNQSDLANFNSKKKNEKRPFPGPHTRVLSLCFNTSRNCRQTDKAFSCQSIAKGLGGGYNKHRWSYVITVSGQIGTIQLLPSESMLFSAVGGMMETLHWPRGHLRGYRSIHAVCTCKNSSDRWLQRGRIIVRAMSWVKAIALIQTDDAARNSRWLALMSLKWQFEETGGSQIKSCFSLCLVIMLINAVAKTYENTFLLHECCFFFL